MLRKPELSTGPMGHLGPYKGFTFYQWWIGYFDLSKLLPPNGNSMCMYALFQTRQGRRPLDGLASCSNGSTWPLACVQPTPNTLRTACDCFIWHKDKKNRLKGLFGVKYLLIDLTKMMVHHTVVLFSKKKKVILFNTCSLSVDIQYATWQTLGPE